MTHKIEHSYLCLTLFKQDIKELVRLFQTYLQDVEFVIDNQHILDDLTGTTLMVIRIEFGYRIARGIKDLFPDR